MTPPPAPVVYLRPGPPLSSRPPDAGPRQAGVALAAVVAAVALLPFLNPKGPGNTAPVDLVMLAAVGAVLVWAGVTRTALHAPYAVPVAGLVLAGGVAALASAVPLNSGMALLQDVFLLAWCAAVTSICRTPRVLQLVVRTWCVAATLWAAALVAAVLSGRPRWAGVPNDDFGRASQLFDHPNMAGNYFMVSLFVVIAARYPRRRSLRLLSCALILGAVVLAGSNTALLAIPVAAVVMLYLSLRSRAGSFHAVVMVGVLLLAGGAVWTVAAEPVITAVQESDNPFVHYSVSRGSRSADARQSLFASQLQLFREGPLLGLGPAGTKSALDDASAKAVKESHNDYLATLVERGPLGVLALMALIGAVAVRAGSIDTNRLDQSFLDAVPNPRALIGVVVTFLVTALTHEVLHYRHLWALLAVIAALHLFGRRTDGR